MFKEGALLHSRHYHRLEQGPDRIFVTVKVTHISVKVIAQRPSTAQLDWRTKSHDMKPLACAIR